MLSTIWKLGATSGTQEFIPAPMKDLDRTPTQVAAMQQSLGGADTRHVFAYKRTWSLTFDHLTDTEYTILLNYWDGTKGNGPFSLHDPYGGGADFTVNITGFTEQIPLKDNHTCTLTFQEVNGA